MNTLVCISHVPDTTAKINFTSDGRSLDAAGIQFVINPYDEFGLTKALHLKEGTDLTIFATGHLVWESLEAAKTLAEAGISAEVINIHTIKPLDNKAILDAVKKTKCVVTAEEHMLNGGLGDSIAQLLGRELPTPIEMVGVNDTFGESGTPMQLLAKYGLDAKAIVAAAKKAVARK